MSCGGPPIPGTDQLAGGGAAAATVLAIVVYVYHTSLKSPASTVVRLRECSYLVDDLRPFVTAAAKKRTDGFSDLQLNAGKLFVVDDLEDAPALPASKPLKATATATIAEGKCILLDLGDVVPAGAGAAAAAGGGGGGRDPTADSSSLSGPAAMSTTQGSEVAGRAPLPQDGSQLTPGLAAGTGQSGFATMGPDTVDFRSRSGGRQLHSLVLSAPETVSDFVRRALGFGGLDLGDNLGHEHNE